MTKQQMFIRKLAHLLHEYDASIFMSGLTNPHIAIDCCGELCLALGEYDNIESETLFREILED